MELGGEAVVYVMVVDDIVTEKQDGRFDGDGGGRHGQGHNPQERCIDGGRYIRTDSIGAIGGGGDGGSDGGVGGVVSGSDGG